MRWAVEYAGADGRWHQTYMAWPTLKQARECQAMCRAESPGKVYRLVRKTGGLFDKVITPIPEETLF